MCSLTPKISCTTTNAPRCAPSRGSARQASMVPWRVVIAMALPMAPPLCCRWPDSSQSAPGVRRPCAILGGRQGDGQDGPARVQAGRAHMLSVGVVVAAALLWLGVLFAAALYGERHPKAFAGRWRHVYALSLAVHCTSWTFYGTITQAARHGWPVPPTFLGAILFYVLAFPCMVRLVRLARESNATSLADLIATRLGKDAWLAATVTLVAALGLIPYIALQLKAVTMSFGTLTGAAVADVAQV